MAATRLIALHKNKGKSVAACLKSRTDYAQNPDKTQQGELVSSYECSPLTVDEEFMLSKRQYELATGRRQKSDVIAYQIRQSFKPGAILLPQNSRNAVDTTWYLIYHCWRVFRWRTPNEVKRFCVMSAQR